MNSLFTYKSTATKSQFLAGYPSVEKPEVFLIVVKG